MIGITQIIEFKSTTPYRVSGGIVNLSWKTRNSFFCLLITGFRLRYFKPTSSELNIVLQKDQKFNLISFGLFSIASKKIIVSVNQIKKEIVLKPMLKMALPLVLIAAVSIITSSMDQLMLGWLKGSREVGIYSVASKLSFFMTFFLLVSNSAISPNIAFLFKENKIKEIKILVKKVTFSLTLFAFTVLFLFTFGGNFLLGIWGEEFKEAYWPLIILSVGQLTNNVTGCVGVLLIMCGFEKTHGYISLISLLFNIILNYFLIRVYGVMGAAIASSTVIFVENIIKFRLVRLKILNRSI